MCNVNEQLVGVRHSIKFYRCFRDEGSRAMVKELQKEESMLNEMLVQQARIRMKYVAVLLACGEYEVSVLESMSLVELRDAVEEVVPSTIRVNEARLNGSVTKTVVLKKVV